MDATPIEYRTSLAQSAKSAWCKQEALINAPILRFRSDNWLYDPLLLHRRRSPLLGVSVLGLLLGDTLVEQLGVVVLRMLDQSKTISTYVPQRPWQPQTGGA